MLAHLGPIRSILTFATLGLMMLAWPVSAHAGISLQAYLKAFNAGNADHFGESVDIDGDTAVIGAPDEDGGGTGINPGSNDSVSNAGAAYVLHRDPVTGWGLQAYLKAPAAIAEGGFGRSVAISGNTIVVGSRAVNVVCVFVRDGTTWTQQAALGTTNLDGGDQFGFAVAIEGDTLVASAAKEDGSGTGANPVNNNSLTDSGAAYVFVRSGTSWTQQAYLKASNPGTNDYFGMSVGVSGDIVAVGAHYEAGSGKGINPPSNELANYAGAVYIYSRSGTTWTHDAYVKASDASDDDRFGYSVSVSGETVVVGAHNAASTGAVYAFVRSGGVWSEQAYIRAPVPGSDWFGHGVCLDGDTLVVGAPYEYGSGTGVNPAHDNLAGWAGAAYTYTRVGTTWGFQSYLKASNTASADMFGRSVAISNGTVVSGAIQATVGAGAEGAAYFYTGFSPVPEIAVEHPVGTNLVDGTSSIAFGSVLGGGSSPEKTFTVKNIGAGALNIASVAVTGAHAADFVVTTTELSNSLPPATGSSSFTVSFRPTAPGARTAVLQIVSDDDNEATFDITLTGTGLNNAPTITDIASQTIAEDGSTGALPFTVGDLETNASSLVVTRATSNATLVPLANVMLGGSGASRTVTVTPAANQSGSATITVTVNDGTTTTSDTFLITVNAVNDAPTLSSINPATILEDAAQQTVSLSGITAGPNENQFLSITATSDNTAVIPHPTVVYSSPSSTGSLRYTPLANASGTATITVTVNDGQAADNTTTQTFTVTVTEVNDPPTLGAIGNPAAILEDAGMQTIGLNGISSGPNESQALGITAVSNNTALIPHPAVTYTTPNASLSYTPEANAHGTAIITVTVNDGQAANNTFSRTFTVTVTAVNDAPTISDIPNTGTNEDTSTGPVPLVVGDVDTGAGALTLTGSSSNPALVPDASIIFGGSGTSRTFSITPASNQSGSAIITLTVSDGVLTASDTFELTVTAVDDAPTLSAIANQVITYNTLTNALSFTVGDVETAAADLLVTASSSNLTLLRNSSVHLSGSGASREVVLVPEFNQTGSTTVTLSANDGAITSTTSFTLTVNAPEIVVEQPFGSNLADGGTRDFGSVPVGGTGSMVFYIRNTNAASLTGLTITKSGPNAAQFHLVAAPVSPVVGPSGNTAFTLQFIPAGIGSKTATFQIANNDPNESPFDITVTGRGTFPRPNWRQEHFGTTAENAESADQADPDRDGIANLLEYALGLDPAEASNTQVPLAQLVNDSLVLIFDEPEGVTGIDYAAEWNNTLDPANWTSAGIDHAFVNGRHTFTLPTASLGRAYMRLKVAASP